MVYEFLGLLVESYGTWLLLQRLVDASKDSDIPKNGVLSKPVFYHMVSRMVIRMVIRMVSQGVGRGGGPLTITYGKN